MIKIIEAPSIYQLNKKVEQMNEDAYDKWAKNDYKGDSPKRVTVGTILSNVETSGTVRASVCEDTESWGYEPEVPMPGKSGIRHPLGPMGGGV